MTDISWEIKGKYEEIERIVNEDGIKLYLKGHKYPWKGNPTKEAVEAINACKSALLSWPLAPLSRIIAYAEEKLRPYSLSWEEMNPCARELRHMLRETRLGFIISHIIEWDSAYRFRFQDLMSETSKERLASRPLREILRLLAINARSDYHMVHRKIRKVAYLLIFFLFLPHIKREWRYTLSRCDFSKLQLDGKGDNYWIDLREDYDARA